MSICKLMILLIIYNTISNAYTYELTNTLEKIKENNTIIVGYRESSVPFSYYNDLLEVVGYSQEYSNAIIQKIKKKINTTNLKVQWIPINSSNRIPLLQNGTYDFECSSTSNTLERQQQVDFSNTIFITSQRLMVNKQSLVKDFNNLTNKTVVVTAGTTSEMLLHKLNDKKKMNIHILNTRDHSNSFHMLENGRAIAFMMDNILLVGERIKSHKPEEWKIVGTPQSKELYSCVFRKNDPEFKKLINTTIEQIQISGKAITWYNKWFKQPIPPKNINMKFNISSDMKQLFKHPNDKLIS